jgi:hypothetical protein
MDPRADECAFSRLEKQRDAFNSLCSVALCCSDQALCSNLAANACQSLCHDPLTPVASRFPPHRHRRRIAASEEPFRKAHLTSLCLYRLPSRPVGHYASDRRHIPSPQDCSEGNASTSTVTHWSTEHGPTFSSVVRISFRPSILPSATACSLCSSQSHLPSSSPCAAASVNRRQIERAWNRLRRGTTRRKSLD